MVTWERMGNMERATRMHYIYHADPEPQMVEDVKKCHWCQIRSFATHATLPITIVNETTDGAVIPPDFRFIDKSQLGSGVRQAAPSFHIGCVCVDDKLCMNDDCHCLGEVDSDDSDASDSDDDRRGANEHGPKRRKFAYHSHGVKAGRLRSGILDSREPIYECHDGCACSDDCPNRVVERGRKVPLQIFRTTNRGWGVRTMADIQRGQFVDKYLGEIITPSEADRRRSESGFAQRKDVYLFALDKFSDPQSLDPRLVGPPLEVDGEYMSGPTRFINHSCNPNMRIFARVGEHADKHLHDLALFAIRDISRGRS